MHTPLIKQYCELKENYDDCILFFRVGDFYEMFFNDAKKASHNLNITLTSHGKAKIPMCGIPHHSSSSYINQLVRSGHKVALCEEVEDTGIRVDKKAPLKRDVVRVVTAGTVTESSMLDSKSYNFLMCFSPISFGMTSYAIVDLSIGDFFVEEVSAKEIRNVIAKWCPSECLMPKSIAEFNEELMDEISEWKNIISFVDEDEYNLNQSQKDLKAIYQVSHLDGFGQMKDSSTIAAGYLANYLMYTQKTNEIKLKPIAKLNNSYLMHLDKFTRDNLEISKNLQGDSKETLFGILDCTVTSSGARLLKFRLMSPLKSLSLIRRRLDSVEFFVKNNDLIGQIREHLMLCSDLERDIGRVAFRRSCPEDLISIANSLVYAKNIYHLLHKLVLPIDIQKEIQFLTDNDKIIEKILDSMDYNPVSKENGFVRSGYSSKLDEEKAQKELYESQIPNLEKQYKNSHEILSLKIIHNNALGYHIEIANSEKGKVPYNFAKVQSLASISRYMNDTLNEINSRISNLCDSIRVQEAVIFDEIIKFAKQEQVNILRIAKSIAIIDIAVAMAKIAVENNYCKPIMNSGNNFVVKEGRHPVVEKICKNENFTSNDCDLNKKKFMLMTGPNMSGKSTYLRQNAIITVMAHSGCYVPASYVNMGIVEEVFVRVGASDNLSKGMSTFMIEMTETACILNQSTKNSLIVIDEVGRGTSTKEGSAIASAIMENLSKKKARTFFATHYHELVNRSLEDENISCATIKIEKAENKISFLHKVVEGCSKTSYAFDVCKMAGLPQEVIDRAEQIVNDS
ncbi:DNA mismatch repair protein MutS [Candidatus Cytomitobacter indipagum]|uniref:DNA mismatch repair protein MutS n=1 Tax=Candidatus Cytomitobacter indipagum TaxID=2601575 RepID=A0A5C0UCU2_9PROT|nr:DNA mismatch repair protein MutS [Candidatus Cytomitobacter indipagum]QEK37788.1 DNA mismatch repair protein MutS [Candidatus Cytomitobacter indipagum]